MDKPMTGDEIVRAAWEQCKAPSAYRIAHEFEKHSAGLAELDHSEFDEAIELLYDYNEMAQEATRLRARVAELEAEHTKDREAMEAALAVFRQFAESKVDVGWPLVFLMIGNSARVVALLTARLNPTETEK